MTRHAMGDIETLGLADNAVITSIAFCEFHPEKGPIYDIEPLYIRLCINQPGRLIEPGTLEWWLKQSAEARNAWLEGEKHLLDDGLRRLVAWLGNFDLSNTKLWSRGINFDYTILGNAFKQCNITTPWRYTQLADVRTFDALVPRSIIENVTKTGEAHNALDDCIFQSFYVKDCMTHLRHAHDYANKGEVA